MRLALLAPLAFAACARLPAPAAVDVVHHGAIHDMMHAGATGAVARVAPPPDAVGLGALAGLAGEITVVDGVVWTSRSGGAAPATTQGETPDACLYVEARVPRWRTVVVDEELRGPALDVGVRRLAAAAGVDVARPFPFVVVGRVRELAWHVIDGARLPAGAQGHDAHRAASPHGVLADVDATLVGFSSTAHHGVFTHHDRDVHLHAVVGAPTALSVHVDDVVVPKGALLKVPTR